MKYYTSVLFCLLATTITAQKNKIIGTWEGKINVGVQLRIVFNFKDSAGNIIGTTDSPDQGIKGVACSNVIVRNDSLLLEVPDFKGKYAGKFKNDSTITGKLIQGIGIDLTLVKVLKVSALPRPQTPHQPYSYISRDVEYDNADKSVHYGATITIPKGKGPFPAVLLITGSGAQNRDEEIFEHKPFAVIADHLTKHGYIVMRVDDRSTGKTTGNFSGSTTADFAKDVNTSLNYLKNKKEVDVKHIGLIGHSEGGIIAPIVASQRNDISFIILLAAPGEKVSKLMEDQNIAILRSNGFTKEAAEDYGILFHNMIPVIIRAKNLGEATNNLNDVVGAWRNTTPKPIVMGTTGIINDSTQKIFVNAFASSLSTPWYKYFLQFDPGQYLTKLHCKVLALNGDKDLQVLSAPNLSAIKSALQKSRSPVYVVKEMPGLNHLFQHCKKCTVNEYGQLEETFSPEVLDIISEWLKKNVK